MEAVIQTWFAELSRKAAAEQLVRRTLGCTCPREVFDHFQVELCFLPPDSRPVIQLIMGERLLVWILDASGEVVSKERTFDLLRNGKKARDERRLNRFRLVLVGESPDFAFDGSETTDPSIGAKVHLHVLPTLDGVQPEFLRHLETKGP